MPWTPKTIRRPDQAFKTAADTVRVTTDIGPGYLKALGNHGSPQYLASDLIGTQLAKWMGLPTFDYSIIEVTSEDEIVFIGGGRAEPGPAFITREQSGMVWSGKIEDLNSLVNPADIPKLILFDTWTRNCDRHPPDLTKRKPNRNNVFLSNEELPDGQWRLFAMDHTHCFNCGRDLNSQLSHIDLIQDERLYGLFPEFKTFLQTHKNSLTESLNILSELSHPWIEDLVNQPPKEWEVTEAGRKSLSKLLIDRAEFVSTNFMSWIEAELR